MEPFELTLNQVNFEEKDLSPTQRLYSFSNVVSFDSDFVEDEAEGVPILSRKVRQRTSGKGKSKKGKAGVDEIREAEIQRSKSGLAELAALQDVEERRKKKLDRVEESPEGKHPSSVAGRISRSFSPKEGSLAFEPNTNSFEAFTHTVEALALQKSVIGHSDIKPASADEVAKVIAMTQQQMKKSVPQQQQNTPPTHKQDEASQAASSQPNDDSGLAASPTFSMSQKLQPQIHHLQQHNHCQQQQQQQQQNSHGQITESVEKKSEVKKTDLLENVNSKQQVSAGLISTSDSEGSLTTSPEHSNLVAISTKAAIASAQNQNILTTINYQNVRNSNIVATNETSITKVTTTVNKTMETHLATETHVTNTSQVQNVHYGESQSNNIVETAENTARQYNNKSDAVNIQDAVSSTTAEVPTTKSAQENMVAKESPSGSQEEKKASSAQETHLQTVKADVINVDVMNVNRKNVIVEHDVNKQAASDNTVTTVGPAATSVSSNLVAEFMGRDDVDGQRNQSIYESKVNTVGTPERGAGDGNDTLNSANVPIMRLPLDSSTPYRVYQTQTSNVDLEDIDLRQLLKEKVKLEGQLEMLDVETRQAIRDRAELQTQNASQATQIKSLETTIANLMGDKHHLVGDVDKLRDQRSRLEQVIVDAQKLMEDKDLEMRQLLENIQVQQETAERYQERIKTLKHDVQSRDSTVQALKGKVAQLYVDFQTTNQNKILAENEVRSLQSEMKSMKSAKEWYAEQLRNAQEAKATLQKDITKLQADSIAQTTFSERLKADNMRVKQQLADVQQRALHDKEMLARHLETIEADMLEREAAFAQLQRDRDTIEKALTDENGVPDFAAIGELQDELVKLKNETRRKTAQVSVLEHEQAELVKRLTLAQESILERDQNIETLQRKAVDVEMNYQQKQREYELLREEMEELKDRHVATDAELNNAREEKKTFDAALQKLKDDMLRVDSSFRHMKQELANRGEELNQVRTERNELTAKLEEITQRELSNVELAEVHKQVLEYTQQRSAPETSEVAVNTDHVDMFETVEGKQGKIEMQQLQQTVPPSNRENVPHRKPEQEIETNVPDDNKIVDQLKLQISQIETQKSKLENDFGLYKESSTMTIEELQSHKLSIENAHSLLESRFNELNTQLEQEKKDKATVENDLATTKTRISEMERRVEAMMTEGQGQISASHVAQETVARVTEENEVLRSQLESFQAEAKEEVTKEKEKVMQLGRELETQVAEWKEVEASHEKHVTQLNVKIEQYEQLIVQLRNEIHITEQNYNVTINESNSSLRKQIEDLQKEKDELNKEKADVESALEEAQGITRSKNEELLGQATRLLEMEREIEALKHELETRKETGEDPQQLALDLEREKGRLAGVMASHSALKEHAESLEATLAKRESSVAAMGAHVNEELGRKDNEMVDLRRHVKEVQQLLDAEKQASKELKKQHMVEKGAQVKLRRQLESLWVEHDQMKADHQAKVLELESLTWNHEKSRDHELELKGCLETSRAELAGYKREVERLERQLQEHSEREPVLQQQIQSLEVEVIQKSSEIEALKQQLTLVEERQAIHTDTMQRSMQTVSNDLTALRAEMATVKQEKLALQGKVAELKSALRASVQHSKVIIAREKQSELQTKQAPVPPFDMAFIERLLEDTKPVTARSKPLSFLQATLSGLRGEISSLQDQLDEHTEAVQTSSKAWKELEAQVEDLKAVCKLTSGDRQKLLVAVSSESSVEDVSKLTAMGIQVPPAVSLPQDIAAMSSSSTVMTVITTPSEPGVWAKPPVTVLSTGSAANGEKK